MCVCSVCVHVCMCVWVCVCVGVWMVVAGDHRDETPVMQPSDMLEKPVRMHVLR